MKNIFKKNGSSSSSSSSSTATVAVGSNNKFPMLQKEQWKIELYLGLGIFAALGLFVGLWIIDNMYRIGIWNLIIPLLSILLAASVGFSLTFKKVKAGEIIGVYNSITEEPLFNATQAPVWNKFWLRKFSKVYDYTTSKDDLKLTNLFTKDESQIKSIIGTIFYKVRDPLIIEKYAGNDDVQFILRKVAKDYLEAVIPLETLKNIENNTIGEDIASGKKDQLIKYFATYGYSYEDSMFTAPVTSDALDTSRDEIKVEQNRSKKRRIAISGKDSLVALEFISELLNKLNPGEIYSKKDLEEKAKRSLGSDYTEEELIDEMLKIVKNDTKLSPEKLSNLRDKAKLQVNIAEGDEDSIHYSGLNKAKTMLDLNKKE